jgi:PAS domain S-box-containing protein
MTSSGHREQLYTILSDPDESIEARISDALRLGARYLDVSIGFLTRIEDGTQKIVQSVGDHDLLQPGATCPLDEAYCRRTFETEGSLAVQDADGSSAVSDTAVHTFGFGAYIGARIMIRNETYGTICFADTDPRDNPFSEAESYFVELAARLAGQALEQQSYELAIADRDRQIGTKEEVYRSVCEASFDLILQVDSEGRFMFISSDCESLLGYPPEWYLDQPFTAMLPDQETVDAAEEIYDAVMSGETVVREFFPLEHRNGDQVLVDIQVTPLYAGDTAPDDRTPADIVGVQGMIRDARGRRRDRRMIRILNRVLRHNLRNDLNVIGGYAEMLRDRLDDEPAGYADRIVDKTARLTSLSTAARKLEQNIDTPPEIDSVDIVPVVGQLVTEVDDEFPEATIDLRTPESAVAESSPRLATALRELLENAAVHAGDAPSIHVEVTVDDALTSIRIEDDGPGLPEQDRAVLLSGDESPLTHGSGLGLWLAHWIVGTLDGQLTVQDNSEDACLEISLRRSDRA